MRTANLILILALASLLNPVSGLRAQPAQDVERRINDLLSRMTLEEKLGQMSQSTSMQIPLSDQIRNEIRARPLGFVPQRRRSGRARRSAAHRDARKAA